MDSTPRQGTDDLPTSVFAAIERAAARYPDVVALEDDADRFTYAELERAARNLAAEIVAHPGRRVGIIAPCQARTVVGQMGIAATGRAYVPLDPHQPPAVLARLVELADVDLILAMADQVDLAEEIARQVPVLRWRPDVTGEPTYEAPAFGLDQELSVFFTSGSTGVPKGVVHTQRFWLDSGAGHLARGTSGPDERILLIAPMALAPAPIITAFALYGGATLSLWDVQRRGLADLHAWIADRQLTGLPGVTSALRAVVGSLRGATLPSVRWVMPGGESLSAVDVEAFRTLAPAVDTYYIYASTELALISLRTIRASDPLPEETPLHTGFRNEGLSIQSIVLRQEDGRPVEQGEVGTIEIVGDRLSRYLDEEVVAGEPMRFATADLGRFAPDGGLQVIGRTDQVVKIRGVSVDMIGVELQMREIPGLADVSVVLGRSRSGVDQMVAYVIADPDAELDEQAIRRDLRPRMPAHMVPGRIEMVDTVPRLRNGKPDRVALGDRACLAGVDRPGRAAAASPLEKAIAAEFAAVLDLDPDAVSPDDDFFDLGGSSLHVAELLVRLEGATHTPIPASVLTYSSTPAEIARLVEADGRHRSSLILLQGASTAAHPPVNFGYDLHGTPFRLRDLATALGPDQPVRGFECPLIFGEPGAPTTLEAIAALHVADLVAAQPEGPYHLCGYSIGGVLVWEIATQLARSGRELGFVGVIDFGPIYVGNSLPRRHGPKPPGTYPVRAPLAAEGLDRLRFHLDTARAGGWFRGGAHLSRIAGFGREYELGLARLDLARKGRVRPELRASWAWYTLMRAAVDWRPSPVDTRVDLFLCDQTAIGNIQASTRVDYETRRDPTLGWDQVAGQVEVTPILGYHNALVEEPYVTGTGAAVRQRLDEAVARTRSAG